MDQLVTIGTEPLEGIRLARTAHAFTDQQERIRRETRRMGNAGGGVDRLPRLQHGHILAAIGFAVMQVHRALEHGHMLVGRVHVKLRAVFAAARDEHQRILALPEYFHVFSGFGELCANRIVIGYRHRQHNDVSVYGAVRQLYGQAPCCRELYPTPFPPS